MSFKMTGAAGTGQPGMSGSPEIGRRNLCSSSGIRELKGCFFAPCSGTRPLPPSASAPRRESYLKCCIHSLSYQKYTWKPTSETTGSLRQRSQVFLIELKFTWDKEIWLEERGLPWHSWITEQFQMPLSRLPGGCVFWNFLISPFTQGSNCRYWSY